MPRMVEPPVLWLCRSITTTQRSRAARASASAAASAAVTAPAPGATRGPGAELAPGSAPRRRSSKSANVGCIAWTVSFSFRVSLTAARQTHWALEKESKNLKAAAVATGPACRTQRSGRAGQPGR